jgi:two-component system phosphate regulon response regulator PhoB
MLQNILLVEDEKPVRDLYARQMTLAGYNVVDCATAGQAQEALKKTKFDAVVLDVLLPPSTDGLTLLKQIKSDQATADIPVIMLTNIENDETINQASQSGAAGYIVKVSTTPSDFIIQLKTFLSKS